MPEKTCFVISPIGEVDSDIRKRSDLILRHVIKPAALECGYNALRADEISEPGMITSQVIQHIVDDALVIADLTDRNPNVFYELAVRHAIRKPFVQIIKKGEQIPFDVAGTRTIPVDHHDLDSVDAAKKEICAQIRALEKDASKLETPISVSLNLQTLKQSADPEQRSMADVLSMMGELRTSISNIENSMSAVVPRRYSWSSHELRPSWADIIENKPPVCSIDSDFNLMEMRKKLAIISNPQDADSYKAAGWNVFDYNAGTEALPKLLLVAYWPNPGQAVSPLKPS